MFTIFINKRCKHLSTVISIRIPKKMKKELEELRIDYTNEIRIYLERRIREEKIKRILNELEKIHKKTGYIKGSHAVKFIREDRDCR